jgi:hypothetical protein
VLCFRAQHWVSSTGARAPGGAKLRRRALQLVRGLVSANKFRTPAGNALAPTMHAPTDRTLHELKRARVELEAVAGTALSCATRAIRRIEVRLARPLRVAIVGEFNSGKSSLANLLVGIEGLPTAVVSSTRIPTLLYQATEPEIWAIHLDGKREWLRSDRRSHEHSIIRLEVGLPSPRLRAVQILDLPGLADPRSDSGGLGNLALYNVDAVIWCTVCTQAWKESERAVWDQLPARLRDRALLVTTHSDLLHNAKDKEKLLYRLRREAGSFRDIVLISTNEALALFQQEPGALVEAAWNASGASALEKALDELLQSVRKHRLDAAITVTGRIAHRTLTRIEEQPTPLGSKSAR